MDQKYRPTPRIKWFPVERNAVNGGKPLAQIAGYAECGPDWFCLRQLWVSDIVGQPDEWRDVEIGDDDGNQGR